LRRIEGFSQTGKRIFIILFCLSALLLTVMSQRSASCNPASRLANIESLAHRGTFRIDDSPFLELTVDKVMLEGSFYSSKPPILSVLATGPYIVFSRLTGVTFTTDLEGAVIFISLLTGAIPYLLLFLIFYLFLRRWTESDRIVSIGLLVFTLNFIGLGYSTGINNHVPAAAALLGSFYLAFQIRCEGEDRWSFWAGSGFLATLAATLELWAGFFCLAIFVYLATTRRRRAWTIFLPAAAPPLALHFFLTWLSTGSILPLYLRPELYLYHGSYWLEPAGIDALYQPKYTYFFHLLVGHHGLFSMTPVFVLGAWSLFSSFTRRSHRRPEALTVGLPLLASLLFLGIRTRNYGGICAGLRWMIIVMPMLFLFATTWLDEHRSIWARVLFAVLVLVGLVVAADVPWADAGPWHNSAWHRYVFGL